MEHFHFVWIRCKTLRIQTYYNFYTQVLPITQLDALVPYLHAIALSCS